MAAVNPIPDRYPQVIPYLTVSGATKAIDFYNQVLGTTERMRMPGPNDTIGHAELELGNSLIMLADESPDFGTSSPKSLGGSPVIISVYVEDVDDVMARAEAAGATIHQPAVDQFYGDRSGQFEDPFGHRWNIASHIEDVPPEEMAKRAAAAMGAG